MNAMNGLCRGAKRMAAVLIVPTHLMPPAVEGASNSPIDGRFQWKVYENALK